MNKQNFKEIDDSFFIDPDYEQAFGQLGLTTIEAIFSFEAGADLTKKNLAGYRSRVRFEAGSPAKVLYLKRYDRPPVIVQLKNWLAHRRRGSCGFFDHHPASELARVKINTPRTVCYGRQWGRVFEKRSFVITEEIPEAQSLEKKLPDCFYNPPTAAENIVLRRDFISKLAEFIKKIHDTGYRHRDLYLCHIFYDKNGQFHLIDLARAFKPAVLCRRYRVKDLAQLYYSAPGKYFSRTDRLRFYHAYTGRRKLSGGDKSLISRIKAKAARIARHDAKHSGSEAFQTSMT